jgi:hypothetical protein
MFLTAQELMEMAAHIEKKHGKIVKTKNKNPNLPTLEETIAHLLATRFHPKNKKLYIADK